MSDKSQQHYHDKGEQDRAEGKPFNEPNTALGGAFNTEEQVKENIKYHEGWKNADKQDKK